MFISIFTVSEYSLLDGANRVDELVTRVEEMGQPAVAITDHGRIAAGISLVERCDPEKVKPIIGCEIYVASGKMGEPAKNSGDNFHLTLLVRNKEGFQNIVNITSMAHLKGFHHKPRIDKTALMFNSEGLILLTGCIGAELPQLITYGREKEARALLEWYRETFDEVRIELMYHGANQGLDHTRIEDEDENVLIEEGQLNNYLIDLSEEFEIPLVATNDAHYLHERDGIHHDTLICKGKGKFDPVRKFRFPGVEHDDYQFYVKDGKEMRAAGKKRWGKIWDRACAETVAVAALIEPDVIPLDRNIIPAFKVPPREDW